MSYNMADQDLLKDDYSLNLDENGDMALTLTYVSLHSSHTVRLILEKVDSYLRKLRAHQHLAHTLQTRDDVLRLIAAEVKRVLELTKMPVHFFD